VAKDSGLSRRTVLGEMNPLIRSTMIRYSMIRSAIACSVLVLFALLAEAHPTVVRHRPHPAESRKPHEAMSRRPHAAASHPKPQKPPKREAVHKAKPPKVPKH